MVVVLDQPPDVLQSRLKLLMGESIGGYAFFADVDAQAAMKDRMSQFLSSFSMIFLSQQTQALLESQAGEDRPVMAHKMCHLLWQKYDVLYDVTMEAAIGINFSFNDFPHFSLSDGRKEELGNLVSNSSPVLQKPMMRWSGVVGASHGQMAQLKVGLWDASRVAAFSEGSFVDFLLGLQ